MILIKYYFSSRFFLFDQYQEDFFVIGYVKPPTNAIRMLAIFYSYYSLLHVSVLREPSPGSTDTLYEQGQQNQIKE